MFPEVANRVGAERAFFHCSDRPCVKTAEELDQRWSRNHQAAQCVQQMGNQCLICGYDRCLAALEFHHLNPREKDFDISRALRRKMSRLQIERELSKCILVCATCHREVHNGLHPKYLESPEDGWD